jgi:hypothetical protein
MFQPRVKLEFVRRYCAPKDGWCVCVDSLEDHKGADRWLFGASWMDGSREQGRPVIVG